MKFLFFTLYTTTTTTLNLSQASSLSVVLGRPSPDHQINTKSICLSSGTLPKLSKTQRYGEAVEAKGTLKKNLLPPRWRLLMALIIQCLGCKTGGFDQITNKDAIILYCLANGLT
ncbi:hypothetical protein Tco_1362412 [Tanacetum coccineum]